MMSRTPMALLPESGITMAQGGESSFLWTDEMMQNNS